MAFNKSVSRSIEFWRFEKPLSRGIRTRDLAAKVIRVSICRVEKRRAGWSAGDSRRSFPPRPFLVLSQDDAPFNEALEELETFENAINLSGTFALTSQSASFA